MERTPILLQLHEKEAYNGINFLQKPNFDKHLQSGITKRQNVIKIDIKGNVENEGISQLVELESDLLTISSKEEDVVNIFLKGCKILVAYKGAIVYICDNITNLKPRTQIENRLPISQYKTLIKRHYSACLDGERETSYWQNKSTMILKSAPEMIFQKSLASYLNMNVSDGIVIEECLNANTTDRTDITITSFTEIGLKKHILEVKWIGKSTSSSYDNLQAHQRANEGMNQLNIYLNREMDALCGHLVIYDARAKKEDIVWKEEDWDKRIDREPSIIALSSASASKLAKTKK